MGLPVFWLGGAGLFVADAVLKQVVGAVNNLVPHPDSGAQGEEGVE